MQHFLIEQLEKSLDTLAVELLTLDFNHTGASKCIFLDHNGVDKLIIHAPIQFKAYIPSKWDGWPVQFTEISVKDIDGLFGTDDEFQFDF